MPGLKGAPARQHWDTPEPVENANLQLLQPSVALVHGRVCSRSRAVSLVRQIHGLIREMLDSKSQQIVCRAAGPQDPMMEGGAA